MNLFTKQKQTHRLQKQICGHQRGKVEGGGINQEAGINTYTVLYIKQLTRFYETRLNTSFGPYFHTYLLKCLKTTCGN